MKAFKNSFLVLYISRWSGSIDVIQAKVGYNCKKDLSYSSASTINASDPVLIRLDLLPLIKPPIKDVNNCFVSEKK